MSAQPHAVANATPHAMRQGSVRAKRSEVKSPDLTSPDLTSSGRDQAQVVEYVTREAPGSPDAIRSPAPEILDLAPRLRSKITPDPSGCWLWAASLGTAGYGQVWDGVTMRRAHRVTYTLLVGAIPEGLEIDHLCRVRRCVNPAHLEAVTKQENQRRRRVHDTQAARQAAYRARRRGKRDAERNETGWWVSI